MLWLLRCALRPEQRTSEVTGRGASERRHVLDENDLALVVTETLLAAACTPMQPPVSNPISEKGMRSTAAGGGLAPTSGSLKSWAEAICIDDTPRDEPPRRDETAEREGIPRRVIPPVVAGAKAPAMVAVAAKRTERRTIDSSVKNLLLRT